MIKHYSKGTIIRYYYPCKRAESIILYFSQSNWLKVTSSGRLQSSNHKRLFYTDGIHDFEKKLEKHQSRNNLRIIAIFLFDIPIFGSLNTPTFNIIMLTICKNALFNQNDVLRFGITYYHLPNKEHHIARLKKLKR